MQNEWLNAVVTEGSQWDVVVVKNEKSQILGALTFVFKKKWGLTVLSEPMLTPFCGVWIQEMVNLKKYEKYHFEKKITSELIEQLPAFHFAHFRFSPAFTDWQPFFWKGFQQTTRYTYRLNLTETEDVFSEFNQNTQRNIRKGEKYYGITQSDEIDTFLAINQLAFNRQKKQNPIPKGVFQKLDNFLKNNQLRNLYFATNTEGGVEAAIYIVFDKKTAYYLAGGATEQGRKQGAMHFLMHHAIEETQKRGCEIFDFEGSMLQGVATFFRGFNGELTPYYMVWKYSHRFYAFLHRLRP